MASSEMFIRYSLMTIVLAIGYDSSSSWIDNCCVVTPAWLLIWSLTHFKFWYLFYHTIGRDLRAANFMIRLLLLVKKAEWQARPYFLDYLPYISILSSITKPCYH